jgi:hypothetical protein
MLEGKKEGAMAKARPETLTITRLVNDLRHRKSWVTMVWDQPPDRHIGLEAPYGTSLNDLYEKTEKTVKKFSTDFAATKIHPLDK